MKLESSDVGVLVGNPKSASRTLSAALRIAEELTGVPAGVVVDVVELGPGLLGWADPIVDAAVEAVQSCSLLVVASPTFKASYTGILKLFLDQVPPAGLAGAVAVPLMLGAGPAHALVPEMLLRPVLVELGASCPTAGAYLLESAYSTPGEPAAWMAAARASLEEVVGVRDHT